MTPAAPPARRRLVGLALRRYREAVGYDLDDAARMLGCDRSKLSRIETGDRGIRAPDLIMLLVEYGVPMPARSALLALARPQAEPGWWDDSPGVLPVLKEFGAIEAMAAQVMAYEAHRVPELAQTGDYARAVIDARCLAEGLACGDARERMWAAVAARQDLAGRLRPPTTLIVAESALRAVVGGEEVTREQVARLAQVSSAGGNVTVQVLPAAAGALAAAIGPMTIAAVTCVSPADSAPALGAVLLPGVRGGVCLTDPAEVRAYTRAFEQLREHALRPAQSASLLREMAACRALPVRC